MRRVYWSDVEQLLQKFVEWEKENPSGSVQQFADYIVEPRAKIYSFFDRLRLRIEIAQLIVNRSNAIKKKSPKLKEILHPDTSDRVKAEALL